MNDLKNYSTDFDDFLDQVDAVYIASPHLTHYEYARKILKKHKHVLCEKPLYLKKEQVKELYKLASDNNVILYENFKTAYSPGFIRLISFAKSGVIGAIKDVDATFTKLIDDKTLRNLIKIKVEEV